MIMQEIIKFREEKGLNQLLFAKKIGVTASCVGQHESGTAKNHKDYVMKINEAFGVSFPLVKSCILCGADFDEEGRLCPLCRCEEEERKKKEILGVLKAVAQEAEKNGQSYGNFVAGTGDRLASVRAGNIRGKYKTPAPEYLCLGRTIKI